MKMAYIFIHVAGTDCFVDFFFHVIDYVHFSWLIVSQDWLKEVGSGTNYHLFESFFPAEFIVKIEDV